MLDSRRFDMNSVQRAMHTATRTIDTGDGSPTTTTTPTTAARSRSAFPWNRLSTLATLGAIALSAATLIDATAFQWCKQIDREVVVISHDWAAMFRTGGYIWFWAIVALGILLVDRRRGGSGGRRGRHRSRFDALRAPALILLSVMLAGLLAEIIKIAVHRKRPHGDGEYAFAPWGQSWGDWLDTSNLGMPSSHAACAFAAATALSRIFPAGWPVWMFFATGTAATRLLQRDHFLSDAVVGAAVGIASGLVLAHWLLRTPAFGANRDDVNTRVAAGST